ncbi:hypothetical protein RQN30_12150 [Arcanobacterium hippocoleae]
MASAGALSRIPVLSPGDGLRRTRQISDDSPEETYAGEFEFIQVQPGDTANLGPMRFEFFAANHTVPTVCIRVTAPSSINPENEVVFAYSGDTDVCEGLLMQLPVQTFSSAKPHLKKNAILCAVCI